MAGLERVPEGVRVRLADDEVDVVASLLEDLAARLDAAATSAGPDRDPVLEHLAPSASRGDVDVDRELRALLRDDLLTSRVERLRALAADLRGGEGSGASGYDRVLDPQEAMRAVEALNDVRVALGATIGFDDLAAGRVGPDDVRADAVRLLDALAWLQGGLIEHLEAE